MIEQPINVGFYRWLKTNGDAIYKSRPWTHQNDTITSNIWYTSKPVKAVGETGSFTNLYAIVLNYPFKTNSVVLGALDKHYTKINQITMLGFNTSLMVSVVRFCITGNLAT